MVARRTLAEQMTLLPFRENDRGQWVQLKLNALHRYPAPSGPGVVVYPRPHGGEHRLLWVQNEPFDATVTVSRGRATDLERDRLYAIFPTDVEDYLKQGCFVVGASALSISGRWEFYNRNLAIGIRLIQDKESTA